MRVETVMLGPDKSQYAGTAQARGGLARIAESARQLEDIGFDGITTPEAGHDPFLPLMLAAEHTGKVRLGTNIAVSFPRSPMITAQAAWDLQNYSGGRFALGLGTQVKGHNERRFGTPWPGPAGPRMREYLLSLQAIFHSFQNPDEPRYFKGEHYQFTMLPTFFNPGPIEHPDIPIYLAVVNEYMARLAGELCQGVRLHPIATFSYTRDIIVPAIDEGASRGGRRRADVDLLGAPFLAVGRDEAALARSVEGLRQQIAFYASTPSYHPVLRYHGWEDIGLALQRMAREGKVKDMAPLISDDMLAEWAIVGTCEQFARQVKDRVAGLFDTVLLDLPAEARADEEWLRDTVAQIQA
ncbi:TIGR03617 family F420-dependent LLM class oxidoreductase [Seongchinamella sediminis]|uniref:TIGR03617 family F420-dependent LLM class oxidoreductase n=1 Tax=Seongchinamella sediminis TaxID=2283635 RepID=A0A3L7DWD3_9GAMM|nr:TIGR03617 family F420-dependent LLM class oxidoreductase [Seongchinamella sediminis]RLQ21085.1 TIGR03617 family F420-dependent LLM class oxidoreductase [Seongchinamella sediminis]